MVASDVCSSPDAGVSIPVRCWATSCQVLFFSDMEGVELSVTKVEKNLETEYTTVTRQLGS